MTYKISKLSILFVFATLVFSCKKNETAILIEENPIAKKSINEQRQYVRDNFKQLMKELKPVFKDAELKAILYSEVAKKFDGEYNVLIKTLIKNPQVSSKINTEKVNDLLAAFYNIDGRNYHPQIYIPSFEKHISSQSLRTTSDEAVEAVFYDGDETVNEKPTYTFNEDGEVVPTGNIADEDYSVMKPLLILGLNENPDGEPILYGPTVTTNTTNTVNAKIEYITVKHHNESWMAGASEVSIKAISTTWNQRLLGISTNPEFTQNNLRTTSDPCGFEIWKMPRNKINTDNLINYPIIQNWKLDNFSSDPIVYAYVVFEADAWPVPLRFSRSLIPSNPSIFTNSEGLIFRSSDESYGSNVGTTSTNYAIYGNVSGLSTNFQYLYFDGHTIDRADIKFNVKQY
jgi:hypothetical protein